MDVIHSGISIVIIDEPENAYGKMDDTYFGNVIVVRFEHLKNA